MLSSTRRFGETYRFHLQGRRIVQKLDGLLNYSSTLKMEAIRSSETSGATQRTTRRHILEDDTLYVYKIFALSVHGLSYNFIVTVGLAKQCA
jgi:hypothetical protein